ncbi:hypothetical protein BVX95_00245 [archaeon D22]|nr:hypothetical protein BVX95_00245 [archaeon D22]
MSKIDFIRPLHLQDPKHLAAGYIEVEGYGGHFDLSEEQRVGEIRFYVLNDKGEEVVCGLEGPQDRLMKGEIRLKQKYGNQGDMLEDGYFPFEDIKVTYWTGHLCDQIRIAVSFNILAYSSRFLRSDLGQKVTNLMENYLPSLGGKRIARNLQSFAHNPEYNF